MLKRLINILAIATVICMTGMSASARSIKVSVDSSQITMGYQTALKFEIVDDMSKPAELLMDKGNFPAEVEAVDWVYGDTTDLGNGIVEMKRALIIQSFDSGVYTIPPFLLVSGPDTLRSDALTLKVNPVDVSQMTDINPIGPVMSFETKWYDYLPDWLTDYWGWILAVVLVIVGGVCAYLILTKKVEVPFVPRRMPVPPYQLAMQRLVELKDANLWQSGNEREYYTRLIDILRDYLQGRFGINAMEMTSQQITRTLNENETTRLPNRRMKQILEIADFVKFAKVRPLPDDNLRAYNEAVSFVEDTRPVEVDQNGNPIPPQTGSNPVPPQTGSNPVAPQNGNPSTPENGGRPIANNPNK